MTAAASSSSVLLFLLLPPTWFTNCNNNRPCVGWCLCVCCLMRVREKGVGSFHLNNNKTFHPIERRPVVRTEGRPLLSCFENIRGVALGTRTHSYKPHIYIYIERVDIHTNVYEMWMWEGRHRIVRNRRESIPGTHTSESRSKPYKK